jgi:ligand-binding sensor domain-containing protein
MKIDYSLINQQNCQAAKSKLNRLQWRLKLQTILLFFVFISACNGQKEGKTSEDKDFDLYFMEASSVASSFGPTSITRSIMQDSQGGIWLATWEGIIRYDGQTFFNFTKQDDLRKYHVFSVLSDSRDNLWFGTIGGGVYRYDGQTFANFTKKDGLVFDSVGCFYEDSTGKIWIGTMGGISVHDGVSFRNLTTEDGMTDDDVNAIVQDKNGKFWIGTRGEACTYDGTSFAKITRKDGQAFTNVRTIIKDSKNNIWLGGNDGLWRYDGQNFINYHQNFVGTVYEDKKGNIWTTTASPKNSNKWVLSRYDEPISQNNLVAPTKILEKNDMFFGIFEDSDGGIWFGTLNGVCRYDGQTFNYFKNELQEQFKN